MTRLRLSIAENIQIEKRGELCSVIFKHIYADLTSKKDLSEERANILQNELISFASSEQEIAMLQDWLEGKDKALSGFELDISRKWSIARKVFTLNKLSKEEKKNVFDSIAKTDDSDKKVEEAHVFDAITANKECFEGIYQKFRSDDKSVPMSVKGLLVSGWRSKVHEEWLVKEYKERYFKDLLDLVKTLAYNHYEFFYRNVKPIDDDLQGQVDSYWKVIKDLEGQNDESGELKVHAKGMKKIVDDLSRRMNNYKINS